MVDDFEFTFPLYALGVAGKAVPYGICVFEVWHHGAAITCTPLFSDLNLVERCIDEFQITQSPTVFKMTLEQTIESLRDTTDAVATHVTMDPSSRTANRWVWTKAETISRLRQAATR